MPDTIIEPNNAFTIILENFEHHKADLELGLFSTEQNQGGFITFDRNSGKVLGHIDKTHKDFPKESADNAWAIACWNDRFAEFLHNFLKAIKETGKSRKLLFGDIIDCAIDSGDIRVCADFISEENGFFLDISDPEKYFQAIQHYHKEPYATQNEGKENGSKSQGKKIGTRKPKIFISYSNKQKGKADDLHFMVENAGYEAFLDSYNIKGGQNIVDKLKSEISTCDVFVLLISRDALDSPWVMTEITLAYAKGMVARGSLIPVQIEEISDDLANCNPIIPKNSYCWIDATGGMRKVIDRITELVCQTRSQ